MRLVLSVLGRRVAVALRSDHVPLRDHLVRSYSAFASREADADEVDLEYTVALEETGWIRVHRGDWDLGAAAEAGGLLDLLEQDLVVALQNLRPDLYFLHAAALERNGGMTLIVAASGGGKSTAAWALLHHGFRYASDELAPIDLAAAEVHGFPRALCLKADPPGGAYPLPEGTLRTGRARRVPAECLPAPLAPCPGHLDTIVFLDRHAATASASMRRIGVAEAAARLYPQSLNTLAHPAAGADAAVRIAQEARCFQLLASDLDSICRLVLSTAS